MKPCSVSDCTRLAVAKGLCPTHYARLRRGLSLETPLRRYRPGINNGSCSVPGCVRWAFEGGMCATHYRRQWKGHPDPTGPVRGRRRPDGTKRIRRVVALPPDLYERIGRIARQQQVSVRLLIETTLSQQFQRREED